MKLECSILEKQNKNDKNITSKEVIFKVISKNDAINNFTISCCQNDLCENISSIFEKINLKCITNNINDKIKEEDIIFTFLEEKNITTARIIKSFICGFNVL